MSREYPDTLETHMNDDRIIALALNLNQFISVESKAAESAGASPEMLPGNGLDQHDFLHAADASERVCFGDIRKMENPEPL